MDTKIVLRKADERRDSIVNDTPAVFPIDDNAKAVGIKPVYEIGSESQVTKYCGAIQQISKKHRVDPNLVMAIMYMETTHGWYDVINPMRKTILPMNIHYTYWKKLGVTPENLEVPKYNIEYGVIIIRRIKDRIQSPSNSKIATLYNFIGAEKVSSYGMRVASIYHEKPWTKDGCTP
jgi:soluble lytic murein transglycosylase-like protein